MRRELSAFERRRHASVAACFVRAVAVVALPALAGVAVPAVASAAPGKGTSAKAVCIAAHEEAQSLRSQKKLHAARAKFVACARAECPIVVRKECVEQLALVEKDAPTVVLEARDDSGMGAADVKVSIDGTSIGDRLTGTAVDVEPGEHLFKFQRADGKSLEQRVLVVEGDKNRKVVGDFSTLVPKPIAPPPGEGAAAPREPKTIPTLAYVAGGVGVLGIGSFAFFALTGKSAEKDLASSCGPSCKDDDLSSVKRDYLIADISLVIGVAALAAAVVLAWPALTDSSKTTASISRKSAPAPWMPLVRVRTTP